MSKSLETKQSVLKPSSVEFDLVLVMRISILLLGAVHMSRASPANRADSILSPLMGT